MPDVYFGASSITSYTLDSNGNIRTTITTPDARAAANGSKPIRITNLGASVAGRSGTITTTLALAASSVAISRSSASTPSFTGLVGCSSIGNASAQTNYDFVVFHSGPLNFRRSSSGVTTKQSGTTWAGTLDGAYSYAEVPSAPQSASASANTSVSGRIDLSWSAPASNGGSGITGYNVYTAGGTFLGSTGSGSFAVTGLTPGTSYSYFIRARNAVSDGSDTQGPNSSTVTATAPGNPTAPRTLTATASTSVLGRIDLSWTAPLTTVGAITGYNIFRDGVQIATTTGTGTTYAATGLTGNQSYSFTVRARNSFSNANGQTSPDSNSASATAPGVPTAPRTFVATASEAVPGRVTMSWLAPTTTGAGGITNYFVYASPNTLLATIPGGTTSATIDDLNPGQNYTFFVRARNSIAQTTGTFSPDSNTQTVLVLGDPNAPTAPVATPSTSVAGRLTLTWTPPAGTSTGYSVFRVVGGVDTLIGVTPTTTFVAEQLTPNVSASFKVRARNSYTDSIGSLGGESSVVFSGIPSGSSSLTVPSIQVQNSTNAVFNSFPNITAVTATTFSYPRVGADSPVSSVSGTLFNNSNININGSRTITTPSTATVQYTAPFSDDIAPNTAVSSGSLVNNTNQIFNGTYTLSDVDVPGETISYAKVNPNITVRGSSGTVTNNTNVVFNGEDFIISGVTESTIQYARINANIPSLPATGTVFNRTNERIFNGTYIADSVPSFNEVTYDRSILSQSITNLATNPSFEAVATGATTVRTNLVPNPSFEVNTAGWSSTAATITRISTDAFSGSACLRVEATSDISSVARDSIDVSGSSTYTESVWVKGEPGKAVRLFLEKRTSADGFSSSTAAPDIVMTGEWQRISLTTTFNASQVKARMVVLNRFPGSHVFFVDAELLEQSSDLGNYFDGSTLNALGWDYGWTATAHASTSTAKAAVVEVRRNLVTNPSVEVGLSGWFGTGTVARVTTQAYSGSASAEHIATAVSQALFVDTLSTFAPSLTYTASAWVKGEAGKTLRIEVREQDSGGGTIGDTSGANITATGGWQRISVPRTFGATGVRANIIVRNQHAGAHTYYVDAVLLEASPTLNPYFDGSTSAGGDFTYAWTGTADASASVQNAVGVANSGTSNTRVYQSGEWASTGVKSIRLTPSSPTATNTWVGFNFATTVGQQYTVLATARLAAPLSGSLNGDSRNITAYNNTLGTRIAGTTPPPNIAGEYSQRLTFTAITTTSIILLSNGALAGNGDVWWDDFMLVEGEYTGDYIDGNNPEGLDPFVDNLQWNGTPNASTSTLAPGSSVAGDLLEPYGDLSRTESKAQLRILYRSGWLG